MAHLSSLVGLPGHHWWVGLLLWWASREKDQQSTCDPLRDCAHGPRLFAMNTWNVTGFDGVDSSCGLTEDAARSVAQEMANKSGDTWSYYDSSAEDEAIDVEPEEIEVSVVSAGPCTVLPDTPEASDVEVSIKLPTGQTLTGGVTMVPDRINGGYKPFGDEPSTWVAGTMLNELSEAFHDDRLHDVLRAVASEASLAIAFGRV